MVATRSSSQMQDTSSVSIPRGSPLPTSPGQTTLPPELLLPLGLTLSADFAASINDEDPGLILHVNRRIARSKSGQAGNVAEQVLVAAVVAAGMQASPAGAAAGLGPNTGLHFFRGTLSQLQRAYERLDRVPWARHVPNTCDPAALFSVSGGGDNLVFDHFPIPFQQ